MTQARHRSDKGDAGDPQLMIPVGGLSETLFQAIMCGGEAGFSRGWMLNADLATFKTIGSKADELIFERSDGRSVQSEIQAFNLLMLDIVLVLLNLFSAHPEGVLVRLEDFTALKQYTRCGSELQEIHQNILDHIRRLGGLSLATANGDEPLIFHEFYDDRTFFCMAGEALREELAQCSWRALPSAVLRLDHRAVRGADALAKKIAVAIASGGIDRRYRDLLFRIGELPRGGPNPRNGRVAVRCAQAENRLKAVCGFTGPDSMARGVHKGWVSAWLDQPLSLEPPFKASLRPAPAQNALNPVRQQARPGAALRAEDDRENRVRALFSADQPPL